MSLSRQLGLGVARIVIDPGHGGYDPGAMNDGVSEADVVLDVSMLLERRREVLCCGLCYNEVARRLRDHRRGRLGDRHVFHTRSPQC